jgi:Na+/H+-dicarboxylate symporter
VPVASVGSGPRDAMHWILPIGRTSQSIAAGYLGLFGLVIWPLAPFAIGFGIWALAASKRTGLHGRGRAIFGIITGVVGTLIGALLLVSSALRGN